MPKKFPKFSQAYKLFKRNSLSLNTFPHPIFSLWLKFPEVSILGVRPSPGPQWDLRPSLKSQRDLGLHQLFTGAQNFQQVLTGLKVFHRPHCGLRPSTKSPWSLRPSPGFHCDPRWFLVFHCGIRFSSVFQTNLKPSIGSHCGLKY